MTSSQDLILDAIASKVEARGLTIAFDRDHRNVGTMRAYDKALNMTGSVTYDFQLDNVHFGPRANRVAALYYEDRTGSAPWLCHSVPELVDRVVAELVGPVIDPEESTS